MHYICEICGFDSTEELLVHACEAIGIPDHEPIGTYVILKHMLGLSHRFARYNESYQFSRYDGPEQPDGDVYIQAEIKGINICQPILPSKKYIRDDNDVITGYQIQIAHHVTYRFEFQAPIHGMPDEKQTRSIWLWGPLKEVTITIALPTA